jgi:hypothetical protein
MAALQIGAALDPHAPISIKLMTGRGAAFLEFVTTKEAEAVVDAFGG